VAKQKQSEPARSKPLVVKAKDVGSTSAPRQAVSCWPDDYNAPVDWRDKQQVRTKVMEWAAGEQDELRLTEYIESNTLRWIKELEQIADIALMPQGDRAPDYDLAVTILLSLIKLSSVTRQRVDLTAQVAMGTGPDLSGLSEAELRAIELADHEKLNELALRIGRVRSTKPS
jgi:hypothetical protein